MVSEERSPRNQSSGEQAGHGWSWTQLYSNTCKLSLAFWLETASLLTRSNVIAIYLSPQIPVSSGCFQGQNQGPKRSKTVHKRGKQSKTVKNTPKSQNCPKTLKNAQNGQNVEICSSHPARWLCRPPAAAAATAAVAAAAAAADM